MNRIILTLLLSVVLIASVSAKHMLVYGDSLSAAYGMDVNQGWVSLLQQRYGEQHTISNASISGETTRGGLARLPLTLQELQPDVLLLELGANDGLQGLPLATTKKHLRQMIDLCQASDVEVVLAGITLPASYGPRYINLFRNMFIDLAEEENIPYLDLAIPGFVDKDGYIQADGLHPTAKAQPEIRDYIADFILREKIL